MFERQFWREVDRELTKCSFCNKPRRSKISYDEPYWHSVILLVDLRRGAISNPPISVCPKCRKEHIVQELYKQIALGRLNEIKKELKMAKKNSLSSNEIV